MSTTPPDTDMPAPPVPPHGGEIVTFKHPVKSDPDAPVLQLAESGIEVSATHLFKRDMNGKATAKIALAEVKELRVGSKLDGCAIVLLVFGAGTVWIPFTQSDWHMVAHWGLVILAGLSVLIGLFGLFNRTLVVVLKDEAVRYEVSEDRAVAQGFASSVNQMVRRL